LRLFVAALAAFLMAAFLPLPGMSTASFPPPAAAADGTCGEAFPQGSNNWYFAEGYTGEGFQEWLCLFNPEQETVGVLLHILYNSGSPKRIELELPLFSRTTLDINALAGRGREVSLSLEASGPIVAERPIYFTYRSKWRGCTVTAGATSPSRNWYFAEGCTRPGFEEWILLANYLEETVPATVYLILEDGNVTPVRLNLPPHTRQTISVNKEAGEGRDVGARVEADKPICAERVMYFNYHGNWPGGHACSGLSRPRNTYLFPEGYTGAGFEEWLSLYLPRETAAGGADVRLECLFPQGESQSLAIHLDPDTRHTLNINDLVGKGTDVSLHLSSQVPFLAERPMYFNYRGVCRGGHVSKGVEAPGTKWYLAEGTTRPGFDTYLCLMNPGDVDANVELALFCSVSGLPFDTKKLTISVPARSRTTSNIEDFLLDYPTESIDVSAELSSDQPIAVERPLYHSGASFETVNAMDHIRNLSLGIGPRVMGTEGDLAAADYLAGTLTGYGYEVTVQEVPLPNGTKTRNVIAKRKPGEIEIMQAADPSQETETGIALVKNILVIGAHYDTKIATGSPGANDNASGTAVVLELARCLKETSLSIEPYFVLFGGEERLVEGTDLHHFGSRLFVSQLPSSVRNILLGAVIVDMVGVGSQLYARTMGVGPMVLCNSLLSYASGAGIHLPYMQSGSYSDHEPFENAGIPAVWLEVKDDPWYHTPADSYDKINPAHIENTGRLLEGFIRSLK